MSGFAKRLAVLTAVMIPLSCDAPPRMAQTETSPAMQRPEPAKVEPISDLAALAQRDVEAFLSRQRNAAQASGPAGDEPEIHWNQPGAARQARSAEAPKTEVADGEEITILARPAETLEPVEDEKERDAKKETALDADRLRELIIDLSKELYQEASYADMPLRELLLIAATTLVSPDRGLVADAIPGLTEREREVLGHFQKFFIELGRGLDGSRSADDVIIASIESLRDALSTEPRLEIANIALCTRVGGFGDYDTFRNNTFLAHSEQQVIVYVEIAGFTSELNSKGEWVTELSQQLTIYSDRDGIPVWREDWQSAVDVTRNRRSDFFVVQIITLPKALSVGRYHLKLRVRDEKSRAEAEASVPVEMVADPKMTR